MVELSSLTASSSELLPTPSIPTFCPLSTAVNISVRIRPRFTIYCVLASSCVYRLPCPESPCFWFLLEQNKEQKSSSPYLPFRSLLLLSFLLYQYLRFLSSPVLSRLSSTRNHVVASPVNLLQHIIKSRTTLHFVTERACLVSGCGQVVSLLDRGHLFIFVYAAPVLVDEQVGPMSTLVRQEQEKRPSLLHHEEATE